MDDYITDPLVSLTKMINLSTHEFGAGMAASITYVSWMVFICFCFKKSERGRSNNSRFDKVIDEAKQEGKVKLPEQSFDPPEPEKYDSKNFFQESFIFTHYRDERGQLYHWPGYLFLVGWILCITTLLGSMAIVALWVMNFSKMKTYQWVTGFVVNFFFTILFVEPLKVLIFTVFVAARKKPIWDQDHLDADEKLPKIYYDMENPDNLKRPNKPKNIPPEFDPEYLEPLRFRRIQEGEMNAVIQDFLIYLVYLVIVVYVAEGPKDIDSFYMKENLEDSIVHGGLTCGRTEEDEPCKVNSHSEFILS